MKNTLAKYGEALDQWRRGDATLSEQELSTTINFARIVLMIGLVFLHYQEYPNSRFSPFDGLDMAQHQTATFINSFVLFFFFSAVPLLSMVSGWLFFSFPAQDAGPSLHRRIGRRLRSLYLPLVFWNTVFLLIMALLFAQQADHPIFNEINIRFESAGGLDYINAIFAITAHPVGFQFWFIRDLFVTVLASPLLWLALRHAPYFGMALLGIVWLAGVDMVIFFRPDVVFFFYLGGFLRMRKAPLEIGRRAALVFVAVYIVLVTLRALAPMFFEVADDRLPIVTLASRTLRLVGVLACWGIFQQLAPTRFGTRVARYGGLAFFLYAAHFPLIAEVKILLWNWIPAETDAWMLAHYAASVAVTVTIVMSAGVLLARLKPDWFALMNGGRLAFTSPPQRNRHKLDTSVVTVDARPTHLGTIQ